MTIDQSEAAAPMDDTTRLAASRQISRDLAQARQDDGRPSLVGPRDVLGDLPRDVLGSLETRLFRFLENQPDVNDVCEVGDGIYGFSLAGTPNGVSLTVNLTP